MSARLFDLLLVLLTLALTAAGFVIKEVALWLWILAAVVGVATVGTWLWERRLRPSPPNSQTRLSTRGDQSPAINVPGSHNTITIGPPAPTKADSGDSADAPGRRPRLSRLPDGRIVTEVFLDQLGRLFKEHTSAQAKLLLAPREGELVLFRGNVHDVSTYPTRTFVTFLQPAGAFPSAIVVFVDEHWRAVAAELGRGDSVVVIGTLGEVSPITVYIKNAELRLPSVRE